MKMDDKKSVALLYVCTGRYAVLWEKFYQSFENFFLPEYGKEYFVYTDQDKIYDEDKNPCIHRIKQENLGWPGNTLMRFEMFLRCKEQLEKFDYIFFMNANAMCVANVNASDILPEKDEIVVVQHPNFIHTNKYLYPYERNKKSTAYIPYDKGKCYVIGAMNGGTATAYLKMVEELKLRTEQDLSHSIVAIWHDESQLNHYIAYSDNYRLLNPSFCYPEGWNIPYKPFIVMRDKDKYFSVKKIKKNNMIIIKDGIKRRFVYMFLRVSDLVRKK